MGLSGNQWWTDDELFVIWWWFTRNQWGSDDFLGLGLARAMIGKQTPWWWQRTGLVRYYWYWLMVWNMTFIFPNSWDDDPIWLSYFSGGWLNHQSEYEEIPQFSRLQSSGGILKIHSFAMLCRCQFSCARTCLEMGWAIVALVMPTAIPFYCRCHYMPPGHDSTNEKTASFKSSLRK